MNDRDFADVNGFIFTKLAFIDEPLGIHFSPTCANIQTSFSKNLTSDITVGKQFAY
tara:strand:- start:178 stop:345 length:168 start_codon:yes stop_codon:yes gene_type:complete